MDLNNFDTSKTAKTGAKLHLVHPVDDEPMYDGKKKVTITLLGVDSKEFSESKRAITVSNVSKMRKGKDFDVVPTDEETARTLAECTLGWDGLSKGKVPLEFSKDEAFKLYMEFPWIREQVNLFVGDRANFFTKS